MFPLATCEPIQLCCSILERTNNLGRKVHLRELTVCVQSYCCRQQVVLQGVWKALSSVHNSTIEVIYLDKIVVEYFKLLQLTESDEHFQLYFLKWHNQQGSIIRIRLNPITLSNCKSEAISLKKELLNPDNFVPG